MKKGLLVPTGNVECDLLSFAAVRQFSATSPEVPAFEHSHATSSIAKDGFANRARRPSTGLSICANMERKTQQKSRCQSAHELRWKNRANPGCENGDSVDDTGKSRPGLHLPEIDRSDIVSPSMQEIRRQLHASKASRILQRNPIRARCKEDDTDVKLRAQLHLNLSFKPTGPVEMKRDSFTDKFLAQHDVKKRSRARRRLQKDGTKNSKKNVKWKNSVVPLPKGSAFDNLIRSGVIAKHIAKTERRQRAR